MEQMLEALLMQNRDLLRAVDDLSKSVNELRLENAEMKKQLNLNSLIAKSSCPVYSEDERKEALMEVMKINEKEKAAESGALSTKGIFV